jgi:hypothetical protein
MSFDWFPIFLKLITSINALWIIGYADAFQVNL